MCMMLKKPCADVQLFTDSQQSYGIHDRIEGMISFIPQHSIAPDQLSLTFEGIPLLSL